MIMIIIMFIIMFIIMMMRMMIIIIIIERHDMTRNRIPSGKLQSCHFFSMYGVA